MFVRDPCGIVCIIVTYVAVFYADYVVIRWIILHTMQDRSNCRIQLLERIYLNKVNKPQLTSRRNYILQFSLILFLKHYLYPRCLWGPFHVVTFNTVILLLMMSHLKAVCSDPGVVPLPQTRMDFSDIHTGSSSVVDDCDETDDWTVCTRCETYRPPRAHHCRICKRCIRRMDHHCPWINNCVGERNQKYFIQFLVYVGLLALYAIILVIISWIFDCPECSKDVTVKQSRILHCVILVLESTLFGMFVIAILVDQFQAILCDETAVERVQGNHHFHHNKTTPHTLTLLSQVCGKSHPGLWLFPCHNPPRYSYRRDAHLIDHQV